MIRLFANANYDFIKWRRCAYGLTAAIIVPGFLLFVVRGLNYSIEFTGGTLIQVTTKQAVGLAQLRAAVDSALAHGLGAQQYQIVRTEAVGPKVGGELQQKALAAILGSFVVVLIYL